MTTATPVVPRGTSSPPTEVEIREAIERAWIEPGGTSSGPRDAIDQALFTLIADAESALYDPEDFRPSEREQLDAEYAVDAILAALHPVIATQVARVFQAFATAHPAAPRVSRESAAPTP